jgi:hypothetical protein
MFPGARLPGEPTADDLSPSRDGQNLMMGVTASMPETKLHAALQAVRRSAALSAAFLMLLLPVLACTSCGESKSDDSSLTESLLHSYMECFCDYNIAGMNKCSMGKLDSYDDCEQAVRACGMLAGRIKWEGDNIGIHGNSAIAQVKLTLPADFREICDLALSDVMKDVDGGSDGDPAEMLASAIKKRAGKAETAELSVEVSMTKVNNKWYIVQSLGINHVLSDIRTSVACAYSMIGR